MTVVVGVMSGTSLDGVSAAVVRFGEANATSPMTAALLAFTHRAFATKERRRLEEAMQQGSAQAYCRLHADLGDWLADAANAAINESGVARHDIAAVASHGQTLWHEPGHSSWQIGDPARIAERTGCTVIADFRARDIAAGGQGAPLVPVADLLLFSAPDSWRALQNLGGIGNVTVVPPAATAFPDRERAVRAFDTGPGVVLIDGAVRALFPERPYDVDGMIAARGRIVESAITAALAHPFFSAPPPKSTGRELFSREYLRDFIAHCRNGGAADDDVVATATALTARSIAQQYARFVPEPISDVLLSGGGSRNPTLVAMIGRALSAAAPAVVPPCTTGHDLAGAQVRRFDEYFFDGEAKEAVAFALLGYLHLTDRPGNLARATGACGPRLLGSRTPGRDPDGAHSH